MERIIKQILEINHQGIAKFLVLEIKPGEPLHILYKSQALIFQEINHDFKPTNVQLVQFNDFLVREISRVKQIIPTFKNHFNGEINLIIPNELQSSRSGKKELRLYPTEDGRYWINDNLLKGFKEEILETLKMELQNETITNFNFTELVLNNQPFKIKNRIKDLEVGVSHLDVKYRLTTINRSSSDTLVKTINNLKLKVVYIWSEQDLLSFQISQQKMLANHENNNLILVDWHDDYCWITTDYFSMRQTFKINLGMNQIYAKINQLIGWPKEKISLVKNYLTKAISLTDHQFDQLTILKLKSETKTKLNLFQFKDLKVKLIQAFLETLKELNNLLYFQQGINNVESYEFFHFGQINDLTNFKAFMDEVMVDNPEYLAQHHIYSLNYSKAVVGIYHSNYEHLFTLGEWIKTKIEKTILDREQQQAKQAMLLWNQEQLLPSTYRSRAAYNKQKYASFNEKLNKH